jgi:hypothetical protein
MVTGKRTILSTKRARNRRQKAARKSASAVSAVMPTPESDEHGAFSPTSCSATDGLGCGKLPEITIIRDGERFADDGDAFAGVKCIGDDSADASGTCDSEEDDEDSDGEDGELVFVCRSTVPDFCTAFVSAADEPSVLQSLCAARLERGSRGMTPDLRPFTVRIPAFREMHGGFVAYTIQVATCDLPRREFTVERRFSEFVALAQTVNRELASLSSIVATVVDPESGTRSAERVAQWELPPKTWFRLTQDEALEERRGHLERCLETLLSLSLPADATPVSAMPAVRDFLMLDIFGVQVADQEKR